MKRSPWAMMRMGAVVLLLVVAMGVAAPRHAHGGTIYDSINQWYRDNYDPATYATITNQASLDALRASLITYLWKGNGLPAALPSTIWQNAAPPIPITDNFLRADRMEIIRTTPGGVRFFYHVYVFRPSVKSSNKVSIVSSGHNSNMDATGIGPTIRALVSAGITVVGAWMPCNGDNYDEWGNYVTHDQIGAGLDNATFAAVTLFIDHLIIGLNQMQKEGLGPFSMIGVSGGGWTTTIMAAVDTRIKLSYDVAGSQPIAISNTGPNATPQGDWESNYGLGAGYSRASYEDLYILGSAGTGRRHVQALNRIDPQCFWGIYYQLWQPLITSRAAALGGQYAVHSYDYVAGGPVPGLHFLDSSTLNLYLADLGVATGAPTITAQPANVTVTAGQMATFDVTATGTAPLNYQWRKNGSNISGATAASYTTPATSLADSGTLFSVVVGNSVSSVTSANATLTVNSVSNQPPLIDSAPWANPNPVTLPSTATVNVLAHDPDGGPLPLSYTWSTVSGPATAAFSPNGTTGSASSTASFPAAGGYTLRVTISDGVASVTGDVAVTVTGAGSTGLLLHWKLDDGSGTIAADTSGNGRDGALAGGPAWTTGQLNGALAFDGSDDQVEQTGFQSALNGLPAISVALWVKSDEVNTDRGFLLGKDPDGSDSVLSLRYDAEGYSGGGVNLIKAALTVSGTPIALESSSGKQTTGWRHVVLTWSSGQKLALYVDGVLDTPTFNSPAVSGVVSGVTKFQVGRGCKDTPGGWKGKLDDVRVYNSVLSSAQVLAIYGGGTPPLAPPSITAQPANMTVSAGQSASFSVTATGTAPLAYQWKKGGVNISGATSASYTTPATTSADSGSVFSVVVTNSAGSATSSGAVLMVTAPPAGLLLCWKLDDATGTVAADASGNGRNGTLAGGPAWSTGQLNGALAFDGIDDRVEQTGFQSALNGLSAITLAMWVKSDEVNTDRGFLLGKDPDGSDSVLGLRYDAEGYSGGGVNVIKAALTVSGTDLALESSSGKQTTAWRHVVLTWSSGQKLALYVDGVLDTPTYNSPAVSGTVSGVTKFLVGRGCKDTPGGWKGKLDDVRVYNSALNATQVLALFNGTNVP